MKNISTKTINLVKEAENKLDFSYIEEIALFNQDKVLSKFREHKLSYRHFAGTTGYGYGDEGKENLNRIFAGICGAEDAFISPYIASGTHALALMIRGILNHGDTIVSISGAPYETVTTLLTKDYPTSLSNSVAYKQIDLIEGKAFDYEAISIAAQSANVIYITRSRGYLDRDALSIACIAEVIRFIRDINKNVIIAVDNCYGEFVSKCEPIEVGADLIAGSLIKNAGGGIAPSGGYIAGKHNLVERISYMMTAPGVGREIGSYSNGYKEFYQGLFMAPTTVLNAVKGCMLFSQVYGDLGLKTFPKQGQICKDIICSIEFGAKEPLIDFCRSIQEISPIDSYVHLEPWAMPGYDNDIIMAAGTFNAGSSIELSADSPIREPYIAYVQGALTYEHAKLAVLYSLERYLH